MHDLQDLRIQKYIEVGKEVTKDRRGDVIKGRRRFRRRYESFVSHTGEYDGLLPVREISPEIIEGVFGECAEKPGSSSDPENNETWNRRTSLWK